MKKPKKQTTEKYLVIGTYYETRQTTGDYIVAKSPDEAERIVRRARDKGCLWEPVTTYTSTELTEAAIELKEMTLAKVRKSWRTTKSLL